MSLPTLAEIYNRARIMAGRTPEDDARARLKRSRLHDDLNARLADAAVKFLSEGLCEWARQGREYAQ